jgi:hypothetical protein
VDGRGVVRVAAERLADVGVRAGQVARQQPEPAARRVRPSGLGQRGRHAGVAVLDGAAVAQAEARDAAVAEGRRGVGVQLQEPVEVGAGAEQVAGGKADEAAALQRVRAGGRDGDRAVVVGERALEVAELEASLAAVDQHLRGPRRQAERGSVVRDGTREVASLGADEAA